MKGWRRPRGIRGALASVALFMVLIFAGCGEDRVQQTRFQRAMAQVSGTPGSGVGWVDLATLRDSLPAGKPIDPWAAALGPGAHGVVEEASATMRTAGFDSRKAEEAISSTGSFAFGVRLNGVDTRGFERRLRGWTLRREAAGDWTLFNLGDEYTTPSPLEESPFDTLAARIATVPSALVLSSTERTREDLIGVGESLSEHPLLHFAAGCLGDVVAARISQALHVAGLDLGVELVATGMPDPGRGSHREVFCVVNSPGRSLAGPRRELEQALQPEAEDVLADVPVRRFIRDFSIESLSGSEGEALRIELHLRRQTPPGFLFGALATGRLASYLGAIGFLEFEFPE